MSGPSQFGLNGEWPLAILAASCVAPHKPSYCYCCCDRRRNVSDEDVEHEEDEKDKEDEKDEEDETAATTTTDGGGGAGGDGHEGSGGAGGPAMDKLCLDNVTVVARRVRTQKPWRHEDHHES